jgi:hypothetical protein
LYRSLHLNSKMTTKCLFSPILSISLVLKIIMQLFWWDLTLTLHDVLSWVCPFMFVLWYFKVHLLLWRLAQICSIEIFSRPSRRSKSCYSKHMEKLLVRWWPHHLLLCESQPT